MPLARLAVLLAFLLPGNLAISKLFAGEAGSVVASEDPVMEAPTLYSLGVHWVVAGDANTNASVAFVYRTVGGPWREAPPLLRVEKGAHQPEKGSGSVTVPDGATLFAGSALLLEPDTDYELKLTLTDPDGGGREASLKTRTRSEPVAPRGLPVLHVVPGHGGGTGTEADPLRGLQSAQAKAAPGTILFLHAGIYPAPLLITKNGEPGRPVIWRGAGDGETIIESPTGGKDEGRLISADNAHDVWFEQLTVRNGDKALAAHGAARLVVRRCHFTGITYGVFATKNEKDTVRDWVVSDNVIEGPCTWPRSKGIEAARGIQLTGEGHDISYNRIHGFADAIDTFPSPRCANIDIHHNEISGMTDDGAELDFSERNVRCYENRFTDVFQGISTQPVHGGPVYVFRNVLYNVVAEPFKMHNSPSGVLCFHNTVVKKGAPFFVFTTRTVRHCWTRNNLFVGTQASFAFELTSKMVECDFDYDGVAGGPWPMFAKWNGTRYGNFEELKKKGPVWQHATIVDAAGVFESGTRPPVDETQLHSAVDLRLGKDTAAIDAGQPLPWLNGSLTGTAPDLGAYEFGAPPPHYGPRPISGDAHREAPAARSPKN